VIVVLLLIIFTAVILFGLLRRHKKYITLEEVIPAGEVVAKDEGIVEYKGVQYILGTSDLETKRHLIEKLNLLDIEDTLVVDLSYHGQVIIRNERAHDALRRK
jgi:hypothetical protein